ncbi:hypothetical protein MCUN1_001874 [Malassezia cuniculi]|uniref:Uncharacterized protein n=1 Tax=Malassezia cuniculi TaxID=948313 RepID=A0AAF0EQN0_9BASI|nr:hypothetical protein MCUN1_001874 [Malassezia cuniculi]
MYDPEPRGRVIALDVLVFSPSSPLSSQWMIAVTTTRYDDGYISAWFVENHGNGCWWPTRARLDPSLLYNDFNNLGMLAMGLTHRWSMKLGASSIRLDELQALCLRSPLPEPELGEDHSTWCLDILIKLEQRDAIAAGQALQVESWLDEHQYSVRDAQRQSATSPRPTSPPCMEIGSPKVNGRLVASIPHWTQNIHSVSSLMA